MVAQEEGSVWFVWSDLY